MSNALEVTFPVLTCEANNGLVLDATINKIAAFFVASSSEEQFVSTMLCTIPTLDFAMTALRSSDPLDVQLPLFVWTMEAGSTLEFEVPGVEMSGVASVPIVGTMNCLLPTIESSAYRAAFIEAFVTTLEASCQGSVSITSVMDATFERMIFALTSVTTDDPAAIAVDLELTLPRLLVRCGASITPILNMVFGVPAVTAYLHAQVGLLMSLDAELPELRVAMDGSFIRVTELDMDVPAIDAEMSVSHVCAVDTLRPYARGL